MSTPSREEADLLGTMTLDNRHYYGIHTQRALDNFRNQPPADEPSPRLYQRPGADQAAPRPTGHWAPWIR